MAWVVLFIAGVLEVGWAVGLKYTQGFTKPWPSIGTVGAMAVSLLLLSKALKTIPVGTGYAVWTGVDAVGTVIVGMAVLGEPTEVSELTPAARGC
ncbi:MAG: SMR family transporter [Acidobacteriota bacterium]|nr:SMR family transporter [Acidobacteriota bacterium]